MSRNNGNTINIAITGVGGQGVLTLAEILAKAALQCGFNVRVGEIHGMAQRGGHVVCTVVRMQEVQSWIQVQLIFLLVSNLWKLSGRFSL